MAIAPLRHVCITDSKAEAQDFIDNVRHQIRLSQSLRFREELIDGTMLVEKPYRNEPPREELARHVLVGDAETVAERLAALLERSAPQAHAAALPGRGIAAEDARCAPLRPFAEGVRPLLERESGTARPPRDRRGGLRRAGARTVPVGRRDQPSHAC